MKTNLLLRATFAKIAQATVIVLFFSVTSALNNDLYAAKRTSSETSKAGGRLEKQILTYINMVDSPTTASKNAVIIISFQINENNVMSNVVSYSKIESLDQYLKKCLEGKTLEMANQEVSTNKNQYVKIRFNFDA